MIGFESKMKGFDRTLDFLSELERGAEKLGEDVVGQIAAVVFERSQELCPVSDEGSGGSPPGVLKETAYYESTGTAAEPEYTIYYPAPYAVWVHEMTWLNHKSPTQAKFLETAAKEIAAKGVAFRMVMGGPGRFTVTREF